MSAPGGVNLHPSLTVNAFQDGKYCPNGSRGEGESPLIACAKEMFFGFASLHSDGGKCLPRLACVDPSALNTHSIKNSSSTSAGLMSLRAFPSHKHAAKEAKRAGYDDVTQLGPMPTTLSELHILQHLHYFYGANDKAPGGAYDEHLAGECPYFVAPVGTVTLAKELLNENYPLRDTVLGVNDNLNNAYSLKQFEQKGLVNQLLHDARPPVKADLQFLAFPAVHVSLATVLGFNTPRTSIRWDVTQQSLREGEHRGALRVLENNNGHLIPPALAVDMCRDLYAAVAHMVSCGVYLKWLVLEHLYLTTSGRLQIGGLTGAVMVSHVATNGSYFGGDGGKTGSAGPSANTDDAEEPPSITQLSAQLTSQKTGQQSNPSANTTPKKRKFTLGATFDDEEEEENNNKYDTTCRRLVTKMALPRNALYTVAPEILLGGKISAESSVYTAGAVAVQILTGKPLVKNASAEDKQVQYIYKTLGTPKPMDYPDFDLLPLAQYYGRHIVDEEDNKLRESRSRAHKALKDLCPAALLAAYSYTSPATSSGAKDGRSDATIAGIPVSRALQVTTQGDTDYLGIVDLIRVSMMLVPHRRLQAELLLSFRVFSGDSDVNVGRLLESHFSGHAVRSEFASSRLHMTSGASLSVRGLTAVSRLSHMEEMVTFLRALQRISVPTEIAKKDTHYNPVSAQQVHQLTQMDAILFRKEHAKHTHGKINTSREKDPREPRGGEYKRPSESNYSQDRPPAPQPPAASRAPFSPPATHTGNYANYPQYSNFPTNSFAPVPYGASVTAPIYSAYPNNNMYGNNGHSGYEGNQRVPPPPVSGIPRAPAVPPPPARSPSH